MFSLEMIPNMVATDLAPSGKTKMQNATSLGKTMQWSAH